MKQAILIVTIFAALAPCTLIHADRWTPPAVEATVPAQLPKLAQPLVIDGVVKEWASAACVPVHSPSYVLYSREPHKWNGPADAGFEAYCAWSDAGLCLAAVVADDDVINDRPGKDYWQRDCIEFYLDGRAPDKLMTQPYTKGAYQVLVRPPIGKQPPAIFVNERDGRISGVKLAGVRTATGYTIEMLIPWSAFPGFEPKSGSAFGLSFGMDDYDERDKDLDQPLVISYRATDNLWQFPQNLIRWEMTDSLKTGADIDLGPQASVDVPPFFADSKPLRVTTEISGTLGKRTESIRLTASDGTGKTLFEKTIKAAPLAAPWQGSRVARIDVPLTAKTDAYYNITITALDAQGKPLGVTRRPCLCVGNALQGAIGLLAKTDLKRMSQSQPFRAVQYLGLAARVEQVKRWIYRRDVTMIVSNARQIEARLDLLADGKLDRDDYGIYDLIALTADPEAQVVVEYRNPGEAVVTAYCGAIPLASVMVREKSVHAMTPVRSVADRLTALVSQRKPVTPADVDGIRAELVAALAPKDLQVQLPQGTSLYCGDVHMHTFYSDGANSPAGTVMQAIHCYLDYAVVTDHNRIDGAQMLKKQCSEYGVAYPVTVGEEITTTWAHFNAYPLKEVVSWEVPLGDIVKAAHDQGAVIQWNHPGALHSDWEKAQTPNGLAGTALDAWEHIPPAYDEWKNARKLPVITGSTDTHDGTFSWPERTVVISPSPEGEDLAEAVRRNRVAAIDWDNSHYLFGSDEMTALVWAALADGKALKEMKAQRIKQALAKADIVGMIESSRSKPW